MQAVGEFLLTGSASPVRFLLMGLLHKKVIWIVGLALFSGVVPVHAKKKAKVTTAAKPDDSNTAEAKASKNCGAWPPKPFPKITSLFQLKLEYECRQKAISTRRYNLGKEDAQVSTTFSEMENRKGIAAKDQRVKNAMDAFKKQEQALDAWMRQEVQKLTNANPSSPETPVS